MPCSHCDSIVESPNVPHVVRHCESCGRELRIHEPGKHGIGMVIRKGDRVVIPSGFIRMSLNPLRSSGHLTHDGIQMYAKMVHLANTPKTKDGLEDEIARLDSQFDDILMASPLLAGVDIASPEDGPRVFEILKGSGESAEWWAALSATFLSVVQDSIREGDIRQAVWAMMSAERCRSMMVFKQELEEVVWMGQGAKRLIDILTIWDKNKENSDESFWQVTLAANVYAISQVFAVPLVFIKGTAYVGGMNVNRKDAKLVDYLFTLESSHGAVLVEIKTPTTRLLGRKYRGTFAPNSELVGATMQVLDYRDTLAKNIDTLKEGVEQPISTSLPRCVVIAGNSSKELDTVAKRKAFENFRMNSKDVEIVTYDELFRKVDVLANLFRLSHHPPDQKRPT